MQHHTAMSAAGLDMNALRQMIKLDIAASNELQQRIDQYRWEILGGKRPNDKELDLMEASNKDMTKDVVRRIEKIESQGHKTSSDREMLQALNARLAVCDNQQSRLTELRDLDRETNGGKNPARAARVAEEHLPLGGRPRRPSISPQSRVTEHLRPSGESDARSTSPGPIIGRADSKAGSPSGSRERGKIDDIPGRTVSQSSRSPRTPASPSMAFGAPPVQSQPSPRPFGITRAATDSLDGPPRRPSPQLPPTAPATTFGTPLRPSQTPPQATVAGRAMRDIAEDSSRRHTIFSPPPPPPPIDTVNMQPPQRSTTTSAFPAGPSRAVKDNAADGMSGRRHSVLTSPPPAPPVEPVNVPRSSNDMPRASNDSPRPSFSNIDWSRADSTNCPPVQSFLKQSMANQSLPNVAATAGTPIEYPAVPPSVTNSRPSDRFFDKYISQNSPRPNGDPRGSSENVAEMGYRRSSQASSQMTPKYLDTPRGAVNIPRQTAQEPIMERQSPPRPQLSSSRTSSEYSLPPSRPRSTAKRSYEAPYVRDALEDDTELEPDRSAWPLMYRLLDLDPRTDPNMFDAAAKRALARMSLKHDPAKVPGDPEAPVRWAAVLQAYDTLIDPQRKRAYDLHSTEPGDFDHSDFAKLSMSPNSRR